MLSDEKVFGEIKGIMEWINQTKHTGKTHHESSQNLNISTDEETYMTQIEDFLKTINVEASRV